KSLSPPLKHLRFSLALTGAFFFIVSLANGQILFEQGIVYGGVTANGGSAAFGSGTINMPVQIPPNSTIKKAYLFAARDSLADDFTISLNGINYTFTSNSIVTSGFLAYNDIGFSRPNSSIHVMDITNNINSTVNNYSLVIPPHTNPLKGSYMLFYLYIVFENPLLPKISFNLYLNNDDVSPLINYNLNNINKINNINSVCLAVVNTYACDTIQDGSYVSVNSNTIGLIGGEELNSPWTCVGAWANFAYYNDSLFGLDDDIADSTMKGTDALADIKSYVNNGDTAVDVTFTYQTPSWQNGRLTNPIRAVMLSYSTPCDTFTTTATTTQDTICLGDSVQLNATGGVTYNWYGAFGGLSDTSIANPMASPPQTTTYIVTIKNDSGCVKTEHVKIWVSPEPKPDTIVVTPQTCGNADGSITVGIIPQGTPPFTYTLTNLQTSTAVTQTNNVFSQLSIFNYQLSIIDNNGCTWQSDTLFVPQLNNVTASFTSVPQAPFSNPNQSLGKAPMEVSFFNTSQNANMFEWSITQQPNNDAIIQHSTFNTQHFFTEGGTYEVCLIAYNNQPQCADTSCKTIFIDHNENVSVFIPNVFTPNGDNENDNFVVQVLGVNLLENLEVEVFNRWGQEVGSRKWEVGSLGELPVFSGMTELVIWNGKTTAGNKASEGTYFYVVNYTTKQGETVTEKGTVSLLR
ncbi:MAG: gliding motility-associated C-terminal domain-containing protein, partial [Vicingaceae bacterium]|nr:gliding motility-associated C-terminal domain-containing protein [Vicingaceae bacterium]